MSDLSEVTQEMQDIAIAQTLRERGLTCFTRMDLEPSGGMLGFAPNKAREIFASFPNTRIVVVSQNAPTKCGFRITAGSPICFYRKSSSGKWGRSSGRFWVKVKPIG